MKKHRECLQKILLVFLLFDTRLQAISATEKYPSYSYVFSEFDVDESYIYNVDFVSFIEKNEKRLKSFYDNSLKRGKEILPTMQGLLITDRVSDLFIYLSMVESGFSSSVISPKKAVGLWQFMPATARQYNLTVCDSYDERCDTRSSTTAAINYLNKLYKQFGKWYLAAMAYNCGEGCVEKAIKKAGTDDLEVLIDKQAKYLPYETRNYIKKILLVAMIGENAALNIGSFGGDDGFETGTAKVEVSGYTKFKEIAKLLKMKTSELLKLNKKIKDGVVTDDKSSYTITIPVDKIFAFYLRYKFPDNNRSNKSYLLSHNVTLGETIESIAKKYFANEEEIRIANHLEDDFLELGQFLTIPVSRQTFENIEIKANIKSNKEIITK